MNTNFYSLNNVENVLYILIFTNSDAHTVLTQAHEWRGKQWGEVRAQIYDRSLVIRVVTPPAPCGFRVESDILGVIRRDECWAVKT